MAWIMPVRTLVRLGHPALRSPALPISPERIADPDLQALIDDMVETMHEAHGVGLAAPPGGGRAAPQLGEEVQLFVYQAAGPPELPLHVVINPMITPQARELVYDWEGCLSIPDLRGLVPRHPKVRVQGLDREGHSLDYVVSGFNGVVFLDRMRDLRSLAFYDEWEAYLVGGSKPDLDETAVG